MRMATALALVPVSLWLAGGSALAQQAYNGRWSVEVITEKGECDRAYRYEVAIDNGQVRYAGSEDFNVSGRVAANGAVAGGIARGQDRANVTGRLSGQRGSGTWTTSGGRSCSGRWVADKRG
jgi:hypothetical protein